MQNKFNVLTILTILSLFNPCTNTKEEKQEETCVAPIIIESKDSKLSIGGKVRTEHFFQKNITLLNNNLPDENEYFKNTFDLLLNYQYGKKTFGHNATEAYINLRHKGVWGRGSVFADSDSSIPTSLKLSETSFGEHSHTNGKPLVWLSEAWIKASFNAMFNQKDASKVHTIKIGWFPFELGRGIALGSCYGLNRELLGLYSYYEDKSSPGININGELIEDLLWYDLYYSKFEERNKSNRDTFNQVKSHLVGKKDNPWRGLGKDDEVFAGRLKWKPFNNDKHKLTIEPYVFHNEASDQKVEMIADTKTELESAGLNIEHTFKNFSWGGEVAFNYGTETLKAIDRNTIKIVREKATGFLKEQYSHIFSDKGLTTNAPVSDESKKAAAIDLDFNNNEKQITGHNFWSSKDRFRRMYINRLRGWMGVIDAEYNFDVANLKLAAAYGYASGDNNPHKSETNKEYKGFIGLHELYTGKRVNSVILLFQRLIQTPSGMLTDDDIAQQDFAFTDLQHTGLSLMWKPEFLKNRNATIKGNTMFFWKAKAGKKFDPEKDSGNKNAAGEVIKGAATEEDASRFMGAELNTTIKLEIIKNMNLFADFALFIPGQYFSDVKGVPMKDDIYTALEKNQINTDENLKNKLRLSNNTCYHINVGMEYKF